MTRSLVNVLEQLTLRQDLRYLSCLTYQGVIRDRRVLWMSRFKQIMLLVELN